MVIISDALWSGDLYECQTCESEVVIGFGREPVAYDHEANFALYGAEAFTVERA